MGKPVYISVILPLKLEWEPSYSLPEGISPETVCVGKRVKVRFANRLYSGVVTAVGIVPDTDTSKIRPVESVEDGLESIYPEEIELWRRVADYYLCTVGEVYKAAYPLGKVNLEEAHAASVARAAARREKLLDSMRQKISRIEDRLRRKQELIAGSRDGTKTKARYIDEAVRIQKELETAIEALLKAKKGTDATASDPQVADAMKVILSPAQQRAYQNIKDGFEKKKPVLLHGVTGSGKTEIYIKAAMEAVSKGGNVLYLVPEIALSRQLEESTDLEETSSAALQGIRRGDILTALNGRSVTTLDTLEEIIYASAVGDELEAAFYRDGREFTLILIVGEEKH